MAPDPTDPGAFQDALRRLHAVPERPVRYWWVNQNQTFRQEQHGGYLWSPVHNRNGARNPYYDSLREVGPGDVVFCYFGQRVQSVGIALSFCFDAPKPEEFGTRGAYWEDWGHRISASYQRVPRPFRPREFLPRLQPLLPDRYSPIRPATGDGVQNMYLTEIPEALAMALLELAGLDRREVLDRRLGEIAQLSEYDGATYTGEIETRIVSSIREAPDLGDTEKESLIQARIGQGEFRHRVLALERCCRVTGIRDPVHLIASHIKPWRACQEGRERLDGNNGLALAPHIDHLFDKGFLSFADRGDMLVSPLLLPEVLDALHVDPSHRVRSFRDEQVPYLQYHRDHKLRRAV